MGGLAGAGGGGWWWGARDSLYSEAARLLDGRQQLVVQFVVELVGRNVDPIETKREEKRKEGNR